MREEAGGQLQEEWCWWQGQQGEGPKVGGFLGCARKWPGGWCAYWEVKGGEIGGDEIRAVAGPGQG